MHRLRCLVALGAILILTACMGGGGGGAETQTRPDQADALNAALSSDPVSDPGTLPDSGTARYDGFMTARLPLGQNGARQDYLGDLWLDVDFAAKRNQVTGQAQNFATRKGAALDGRLRIAGGDLFRGTDVDENYTFTGAMRGTLRRGADAYTVDADLSGEFRGRNQSGVTGVLFGDIDGPAGQDIFDGDFAAERRN